MSPPSKYQLPATAPNIVGGDIRGTEVLPWALYTVVGITELALNDLARELEDDQMIQAGPQEVHLITVAPEPLSRQDSLKDALEAHIQYCRTHKEELLYFPSGFLAVHDNDWGTNGAFLVHVDFEEPFKVTAFRLRISDVPEACTTLRNDDDGAEQVRDIYEMKT